MPNVICIAVVELFLKMRATSLNDTSHPILTWIASLIEHYDTFLLHRTLGLFPDLSPHTRQKPLSLYLADLHPCAMIMYQIFYFLLYNVRVIKL